MRNGASVAVIIPALNEEAAIPGVIARIPAWVDRIIVVDNGSTDATTRAAIDAGARVVHEPRRGYGRACLAGIRELEPPNANADIIVFLDGDGSDFPEQMPDLVEPIANGVADMVIGSRTRGIMSVGAMTPPQRIGNALAPWLIGLLWGARFSDLGPFRAIRASSLRALRMDDTTFGWTVQMQIRAARARMTFLEVPVDYGRRKAGRSKISGTALGVIRAGAKILSSTAREFILRPTIDTRAREALGIMAKHPVPGLAKTRLIPALGADGAAEIHDSMVRHTLRQILAARRERGLQAHVWVSGAEPAHFKRHFGVDLDASPQPAGDLGARMQQAFSSLLRSASSAVLIGTDCPELSPGVLRLAFEQLRSADVVLGPAVDGGYYLIGMRRPTPALFADMPWSTSDVLRITIDRARALGLRTARLPTLSDVDEPSDLPLWERIRSAAHVPAPGLSIIIPTLNESQRIGELVSSLTGSDVEVIVADGGSTDQTRELAAASGARVVLSQRGRGSQLNAGAALARSENLLFLHADTRLPARFVDHVRETLGADGVALGAFGFALDRPGLRFRALELAVALRCRWLGLPFGDQALFLTRQTFTALGGFADMPLMEDFELVRRARAMGRIRTLSVPAVTSARRWSNTGVLKMALINAACIAGYTLNVPPARLAAWRNRATRALGPASTHAVSSPAPAASTSDGASSQDTHAGSSDVQIVPLGGSAPSASITPVIASGEPDVRK